MKIFFNASLTGKREFGGNYQAIYDVLVDSGNEVFSSPVLHGDSRKVAHETVEEAGAYYRKLQSWIKQADVAVFEVSYPSLGVGHEVAMALQSSKPVIALHVEGKKPYVLESIPDDRLQVFEYKIDEIAELLKDALVYAVGQMETRFNFFISPKHQNYLDWISKNKKIPRAAYLRRMIERDMDKNPDYEK